MSGIAPAHFLRHRCPAPGPEARQIPGGLDWTASGGSEAEHQRGTAAPDAGMFGKSEQRLDPQFHSSDASRAILDGVAPASGRHEFGGDQAINLLLGIPAP